MERPVPDFPVPGVLFRDITPLIAPGAGFAATISWLVARTRDAGAGGRQALFVIDLPALGGRDALAGAV